MSGILWQPVPPCAAGLDPPNIKISDPGGLDLEAWCLDAWMLKDWSGLAEVLEVTAFWGGDRKDVSHAQASGARRIPFFPGGSVPPSLLQTPTTSRPPASLTMGFH